MCPTDASRDALIAETALGHRVVVVTRERYRLLADRRFRRRSVESLICQTTGRGQIFWSGPSQPFWSGPGQPFWSGPGQIFWSGSAAAEH